MPSQSKTQKEAEPKRRTVRGLPPQLKGQPPAVRFAWCAAQMDMRDMSVVYDAYGDTHEHLFGQDDLELQGLTPKETGLLMQQIFATFLDERLGTRGWATWSYSRIPEPSD